MKNRQNVIVTGSKGFIGLHLVDTLRTLEYTVQEWSHDVRQISDHKIHSSVVFHLAARITPSKFIDSPKESFEINTQGTQAVLDYCRRVGAKCIFTSTSGIYQGSDQLIQVTEHSNAQPSSRYGISKLIAEQLCNFESEVNGVTSVILRLFNVYGPGQKLPFIVPYIIKNLTNNEPIDLKTPQANRDFVHVSDVVDALIKSVKIETPGCHIYNIGTGIPTKISELINLCENLLDTKAVINLAMNEHTESGIYANASAANADLGWKHKISLTRGLNALISETPLDPDTKSKS